MFYSHLILSKKAPLGTVWIAAHLERRLKKSQVNETNIGLSVDTILLSEVPIALRLSGHLLLGVVRIYARKVNYLYHDCSEALVKFKHAFRSGAVDLPPEAAKAPFHAITLPEAFDFEYSHVIPYQEGFHGVFDSQIADRDQITLTDPLQETFFITPRRAGDLFGDSDRTFYEPEKDLLSTVPQGEATPPIQTLEEDVLPPMATNFEMDENLEGTLDVSGMDIEEQNIASMAPIVVDHMEILSSQTTLEQQEEANLFETQILEVRDRTSALGQDLSADGIPEVGKLRSLAEPNEVVPLQEPSAGDEFPKPTAGEFLMEDQDGHEQNKEQEDGLLTPSFGVAAPPTPGDLNVAPEENDILASILGGTPSIQVAATPTEMSVPSQPRRLRRKREQSFDITAVLSSELMKDQVGNTDDIRRIRRKASAYRFEEWISEHFYRMKQIFPKASLHGLSHELLKLYEEVANMRRESDDAGTSPTSSPGTPRSGIDATGIADHSSKHIDAGHIHRIDIPSNENYERQIPPDTRTGLQEDANVSQQMPSSPGHMEIESNRERAYEALVEEWQSGAKLAAHIDVTIHADQVSNQLQGDVAAPRTVVVVDEGQGLSFLSDSIPLENGGLKDDFYGYDRIEKLMSKSQHRDEDGWSDRTRAVAEFLQGKFKALEEDGNGLQQFYPRSLSLETLLKNKSKKQAARMFFETLVLKCQDYIGVEQAHPYADIALIARQKLFKATFCKLLNVAGV